jgi:hypothetical protein
LIGFQPAVRKIADTLARTSGRIIGLFASILAEAYFLFVLAIVRELTIALYDLEHSAEQYARPFLTYPRPEGPWHSTVLPQTAHCISTAGSAVRRRAFFSHSAEHVLRFH